MGRAKSANELVEDNDIDEVIGGNAEDEEISEGHNQIAEILEDPVPLEELPTDDQPAENTQTVDNPEQATQISNQTCFVCCRVMSSKQALIRHLKSETQKLAKKYPELDKNGIDKVIAELKQRTKIPDRRTCLYCRREYRSHYYLHRHEKTCKKHRPKTE